MKHLLPHTLRVGGLALMMSSPQAAFSDSTYHTRQQQHLLKAGESQLVQERRGKVVITTDEQGVPRHDNSNAKLMAEDDGC